MNTGLTLRTAHISGGDRRRPGRGDPAVRLRPGAEERETHIKARALLETLREVEEARLAAERAAAQRIRYRGVRDRGVRLGGLP